MSILIIVIATCLTVFRGSIKGLDFYSIDLENPKISYELKTKDSDNNNLDTLNYEPNVNGFTGVSLGNEYGSVFLSIQNKENEESNNEVDSSKLFDLQFMGHFKNHLWEVNYQNYQGLYITDSDLIGSNLPKANSWSYGASVKHFSKDNFSVKQSIGNFSKNKISDWSWLQGIYVNKSRLFSSDTLIPTQYESSFDQLKGLKALETTNIGIDGGISGMYTIKQFFMTGLISAGLHLQKQEFSGIETQDRTVTQISTSVLMGLGYDQKNGGSWGVQVRSQSINIPVKNAEYTQSRLATSLYYKYFF
jgi:hypothetical protein